MEMAQAVIEAAEEMNAPVILQIMLSTARYVLVRLYGSIVNWRNRRVFPQCRTLAEDAMRAILKRDPKIFVWERGRKLVKEQVKDRMSVCGFRAGDKTELSPLKICFTLYVSAALKNGRGGIYRPSRCISILNAKPQFFAKVNCSTNCLRLAASADSSSLAAADSSAVAELVCTTEEI